MRRRGLVVAGFDGSDPSWTAVDHAATEAVLRGHDVRLVHALLPAHAYAETALIRPVEDPATEARRLLGFARGYLQRQHGGLRVQVYIAGRPAGDLLLSEAHAADLVVVGRRGRGRLPVRLGSVSAQVARHATCPVAVVGGAPGHPAGPVVVGVDAAAPSEAAIAYAFDTADRHGSDLRACYVTPAWDPRPAGELLDRALVPWRARFPHVPVHTEAVPGTDPAAALLQAAGDASLLVVGCRQQDGLRRLLAGSVSHTLVQHAGLPLLVAAGNAVAVNG
ncbi:universal stress protein [Dactylosporangium sp. NPDC050688]|uniref:universal stress protein n=1 Tax=Dactylosporangium sp. NPDC050688 TaxID=3157217 RepID=UPI00340D9E69